MVTGASRGLGLEVARELERRGLEVIATSRGAGAQHALDVRDRASIDALAKDLPAIDVLVNNAGVAMDGFDADVAKETIETNVLGPIHLTEALLPKMRPRGNVVMVSSGMGEVSIFGAKLRARVMDPNFDRDAVVELASEFVASVARGDHQRRGFPSSAYSVSKALLNAYVRALARQVDSVKVNAVCPGWVRTRMGGAGAPRSIEEGARGILWAATLADGPTGGFFRDARPIPW